MEVITRIKMDNAAFFETTPRIELSKILRRLADTLEDAVDFEPGYTKVIVDSNGNRVGQLVVRR